MGRRALDLWRELLDDPEEGLRVLAIAGLCRLNDRESLPRRRVCGPGRQARRPSPEGCGCPSQAGEISTGMNVGKRT